MSEDICSPDDAEFEAIFNLFYPRYYWTTPTFWSCREPERMGAIYLLALLKNGLIERISDRAPMEDFDRLCRHPSDRTTPEALLRRKCANRRGNSDLKAQSWSALLEMQRRDTEGPVVILDYPCFLVYSEHMKSVIVPGNGSHLELMRFVAKNRVKTLFFVSGATDEDPDKDSEFWQLEGLRFSDQSLSLMREKEAEDQAEFDRARMEISRKMHERISQFMRNSEEENPKA